MRAIIRYMQEKLKSWLGNDQVFYGLLLIFVSFGSFALGRLSVLPPVQDQSPGVNFIASKPFPAKGADLDTDLEGLKTRQSADVKTSSKSNGPTLSVVASKSGTKYHLPSCAGAKKIKPENLVTFANEDEAKKAGYTPAANCPGLQ